MFRGILMTVVGSCVYIGAYWYWYGPIVDGAASVAKDPMPNWTGVTDGFIHRETS
jgi:hypothetical protein